MPGNGFSEVFSELEDQDLLDKRALGDGLVPEAQDAIAAEMKRRGMAVPPLPKMPITSPASPQRSGAGLSLLVFGCSFVLLEGLLVYLRAEPAMFILVALGCIAAYGATTFVKFTRTSSQKADAASGRVGIGGYTEAMHAAASGDQIRLLEILSYGAAVNQKDEHGYTALMYAAANGHVAVCQALIERGADASVRSNSGKTALDFAKRAGNPKLTAILE